MIERNLSHDTPYVSENDWTVSDDNPEPTPTERLLTWSEHIATHPHEQDEFDNTFKHTEFYDAMSNAIDLVNETTLTPDEAEVYVLHEQHSWPIETIVTVLSLSKTTAVELLETANEKLQTRQHEPVKQRV